jgi:Homeodomain-like domain-containing protein
MPKKKYVVDLTAEERTTLEQLLQKGKSSARKLTRARILLQADEGQTDEEIATALAVGVATVERTRRRFVEANLEALNELPRPGTRTKARRQVPVTARRNHLVLLNFHVSAEHWCGVSGPPFSLTVLLPYTSGRETS